MRSLLKQWIILESTRLNHFDSFHLAESETWQKVKGSGSPPPPRAAASLVSVGTKLYLFGGLSHMTGWFDDLFVFDTGSTTFAYI